MPSSRHAVLVILDGLRRDAVSPERTPNLWRCMQRGTGFGAYRSVFPSATRVVSASTATGCLPGRHGLRGNSMALLDGAGRLHPHDAGHPGFLAARRALHGRALDVPTMAERLAPYGGAMVFSNVSPGAALAHDPDAHGWVLHRAVAHSPGGAAADPPAVTLDAAGDAQLTAQFLAEAVAPDGRRPALAVLWLGEPDASQHKYPPGSPEAWAAIAAADACLGRVMAAIDRRRAAGEEILLLTGSDHGHETVDGVIDIHAEFAAAGLKADAEALDDGLLAMSNGTSALVHLAPGRAAAPVLEMLRAQSWAGQVIAGEELRRIGQAPGLDGLLCAVSMARRDTANLHGLPGLSLAAKPLGGKPDRLGCGQHGGLGAAEQAPVMVIDGPGFPGGAVDDAAASPICLAPTILRFLDRGLDGPAMDGVALQPR